MEANMNIPPKERRESRTAFDNYVVEFHMAFVDKKCTEALQALVELRKNLDLSQNQDAIHLSVCKEIVEDCERKAKTLTDDVLSQLRQACEAGHDDVALDSFLNAEILGQGRKAAIALVGHLRKMFKRRSKGTVDNVKTGKKNTGLGGYVDRQMHIEAVSEIMGDASSVMNAIDELSRDFSVKKIIYQPIHEACVEHTLELIQIYCEDARLSSWERKAINQAKRDPNSKVPIESDESIQMIDLIIDELTFLNQVSARYIEFVRSLEENPNEIQDSECAFEKKSQELNGVYVLLERFYIFQTSHKAIEIAEPHEIEPNVYASSAVEDTSFVLDKAFSRASSSCVYTTALSVVMAIIDTLETIYLPAILDLPNQNITVPGAVDLPVAQEDDDDKDELSNFTDALLLAVDEDLSKNIQEEARLVLAINSAFCSAEHIDRMEQVIRECSLQVFPNDTMILDCLPKSITEISHDFRSVVENGINALLNQSLAADVERQIQIQMENVTYELTSEQYDHYEVHGSQVNTFLDRILQHIVLRRCERLFSLPTFEQFIRQFTTIVIQVFENTIATKLFNEWGAMQLEREVRNLLTRLSSKLQHTSSLRPQFIRLDQIVVVLNLLKPQDLLDYPSVLEHLSLNQVESFLTRRAGFKRENIQHTMNQLKKL